MSTVRDLVLSASQRYRACGRFAYHFARGKLKQDPVFAAILSRGLLAGRARILDLGCGQGLLAACLLAAGSHAEIRGIERVRRYAMRARRALGAQAEFVIGDVRGTDFGRADGVVILDVLHYLEYAEQAGILERARGALVGDGVLLLRVGDAGSGWGFKIGKWMDQLTMLLTGQGFRRLHCRPAAEWRQLLAVAGFDSETVPMSAGTPFGNVLMIARPR
jgi:SAM-dependent methyltransferase